VSRRTEYVGHGGLVVVVDVQDARQQDRDGDG
jgi:hypothetical protein